MEQLENQKFIPIVQKALLNGHIAVVAYLIKQGVPFKRVQVEIAIKEGLYALL